MKKGWQTKMLGEICTVDWGNTNLTKSSYVKGGKFLAVSAAGCDGRIEHKEHEKHTPVLSAIGAQCGRMFLPEEDFTAIKNTITLTPHKETCTGRFLYQLLTHLELPRRGAAQPFISKGDIETFQVPLPPLPEQQRIVALLDEAFAGLATAKANAERNLKNARAIFENHLQSVFSQRGEGWVEKKLEEIGRTQTGSTPKTSDHSNYGDYISFVKPGDFKADGSLDYENDWLSKSGADSARIVPAGSVLMVCIGATIGKCGYSDRAVTTNQQVNTLTPSDGSSNRFIYYQMLTETFQRSVVHASGQATLPIINKSKWSSLPVWLPPTVAEQAAIAEVFDALVEETQHLTRLYKRKLAALEELKKALLHQAFNGEL
jgi:type I restriction enzyme S subunit